MLWSALSLALSACSVVNTDHCGNQENGNTICLQRDPAAPYCSMCVADNNGCLAAAPASDCLAATEPATSADATSSAGTTTTTATSTTTVDPPTSTSTGTTDATTPTTTTPETTSSTSSSSGDTSTSTGDTSTSTSTGDTSTSTGDTSTGGTSDTSTSTSTSDTTTGGPVCGNNTIEGDEVCDGNNFDGESCKTVMPVGKWGGGSLLCNRCQSLNDSKCCVGLNGKCGGLAPDAKLPCCGGLACKGDALSGFFCKSQ